MITAVASLLWPLLGFVVVITFRKNLANLIERLRRGRLLGQEIELERPLAQLEVSVATAASAVESRQSEVPAPAPPKVPSATEGDFVSKVLDEAAKSPSLGLILLSTGVERVVRDFAYVVDDEKASRTLSVRQLVQRLGLQFSPEVQSALGLFWEVRNKLVHGRTATDEETVRAIDSGLVLLRAVANTPRHGTRVVRANLPLFEDSEGKRRRREVTGLMLRLRGSDIFDENHVFPTERSIYMDGQRVEWAFDVRNAVEQSWYYDPDTLRPEPAFVQAAVFTGELITP
jgi:hypothetical protein